MTRTFAGLFILVAGYGGAALVLIATAFWLHVLLGFVAFVLLCASVTSALNRVFANERQAVESELAGAPEGAGRR